MFRRLLWFLFRLWCSNRCRKNGIECRAVYENFQLISILKRGSWYIAKQWKSIIGIAANVWAREGRREARGGVWRAIDRGRAGCSMGWERHPAPFTSTCGCPWLNGRPPVPPALRPAPPTHRAASHATHFPNSPSQSRRHSVYCFLSNQISQFPTDCEFTPLALR